MRPSSFFIVIFLVAAIVALLSYNRPLAVVCGFMLIVSIAVRLLRSAVK